GDRVPRSGITAAVVEQVKLGIVREPSPRRAAAEPPLIAFPRAQARVLADRLAEMGRLLGIDEQLLVGTYAVGLPNLLAAVDVVRDDEAAHAVLAAADPRDHLVANHDRRVQIGRASCRDRG